MTAPLSEPPPLDPELDAWLSADREVPRVPDALRARLRARVASALPPAPPPLPRAGGLLRTIGTASLTLAIGAAVGFYAGAHWAGSDRAGSDRAGSDRAGSDRAGSDRAGSDRNLSSATERAGSDRAGSDHNLPGATERASASSAPDAPPVRAEASTPEPTALERSSAEAPARRDAPPTPRTSNERGESTLAEERAIVDAAHAALRRSEGEAALAAIARHEARFPEGQLAAERESIRVRALILLGRNDEARWAAERFRAEYPESIFMGVVERAAPR